MSEDKAYAITITINEHKDKLARWQRVHITPEIVEDEVVLHSNQWGQTLSYPHKFRHTTSF